MFVFLFCDFATKIIHSDQRKDIKKIENQMIFVKFSKFETSSRTNVIRAISDSLMAALELLMWQLLLEPILWYTIIIPVLWNCQSIDSRLVL